MPDKLDEDLLEARIGDLEMPDGHTTGDRGRKHDIRLGPRVETQFDTIDAGPDHPHARQVAGPRQVMADLRGQQDALPASRTLHLTQRAVNHGSAPIDDRDRFAHRLDGFHLMRGKDDGLAPGAEFEDGLAKQDHVDGVEAGERLVEKQDLGIVDDRSQELDFLLVPLRQLPRLACGEVGYAESGQPLVRRSGGPIGRHAVEASEEHELIEDGHLRIEPALLGQVTPCRPRQASMVHASPGQRTAVRPEHAERDPHGRGLAGAVGPEESVDVALRDLEGQAVEGLDPTESLVEIVEDQ